MTFRSHLAEAYHPTTVLLTWVPTEGCPTLPWREQPDTWARFLDRRRGAGAPTCTGSVTQDAKDQVSEASRHKAHQWWDPAAISANWPQVVSDLK